jgi:ABC-type uncharacterized transport system substrate-binding protein
MRRRDFITLLGGAAAAWPLAVRAQQAERVRRIGLLMGTADDREGQARVTALKQGLQELGWTDGRNIQIETRFGGADADRIRAHAAELVALAPDVLVGHTTAVIRALRQATSSIPIVMAAINDPVDQGFVSSLAHPGGNITGAARATAGAASVSISSHFPTIWKSTNVPRPGEAAVAAANLTEPQNAVATPKNKKTQKSARGQNHRRDQYRYGAPSWREGRIDDWAARGYAPRERDYQRGAYGRGGFTPNFW